MKTYPTGFLVMLRAKLEKGPQDYLAMCSARHQAGAAIYAPNRRSRGENCYRGTGRTRPCPARTLSRATSAPGRGLRNVVLVCLTSCLLPIALVNAEETVPTNDGEVTKTICRTKDELGRTVFSDECLTTDHTIELRESSVVAPAAATPRRQSRTESPAAPEFVPYTVLGFTDPEDGATLRDNSGNVAVSWEIYPSLRGGHRLRVTLDGSLVKGSRSALLENVDRGEHLLEIEVTDAAGEVLQSGPASRFTLHRFSKLHRAR